MKRLFSIGIALLLAISFCLSMTACSYYRVEQGYSYFGEIPSMFVGFRTRRTEYNLNSVTLNIAYGWCEGFVNETAQVGFEPYSVLIVAYDSSMMGKLPYTDIIEEYDACFSTDGLYVLKEIPKEELSDSKYIATTEGFFKAKVKYNMTEEMTVPRELFEAQGSDNVTLILEIVFIGYNEADGTYKACYSNDIRLQCKLPSWSSSVIFEE